MSNLRIAIPSIVLLCGVCPGCVTGSLATNTGPRAPGERWSTDREQSAHVGEFFQLDFVLKNWMGSLTSPGGVADYCVFLVGNDCQVVEANPSGHFACGFRFDSIPHGDTVNVEAVAYRQQGTRDWVQARGQWVQTSNPGDEPDARVASDSIRMRIYQSEVELTIPRTADDLDPSTGLLRFSSDMDRNVSFGLSRNGSQGFHMDAPDPSGMYLVRFEPPADALQPFGKTRVVFTIKDRAGQTHTIESAVDSP